MAPDLAPSSASARRISLLLLIAMLTACASRSTRMTVADLEEMGEQMAASLANSDAMKDRTPDSPRWTITIQKVQNLSSDVMTESEQWYVMSAILSSLPIRALWDQKNIRLVIPASRRQALRDDPNQSDVDTGFGAGREPTHVMNATFRSATRADAKNRTEYYFCEFEMLDLQSGEPVWNDRFEYKRAAKGHVWD